MLPACPCHPSWGTSQSPSGTYHHQCHEEWLQGKQFESPVDVARYFRGIWQNAPVSSTTRCTGGIRSRGRGTTTDTSAASNASTAPHFMNGGRLSALALFALAAAGFPPAILVYVHGENSPRSSISPSLVTLPGKKVLSGSSIAMTYTRLPFAAETAWEA